MYIVPSPVSYPSDALAILPIYQIVLTQKRRAAYAFARTVLKVGPQEKKAEDPTISTSSSSTSATATATTITEQPASSPAVEPIQRPPIPEEQQRELYKWMLEEKRKAKPRDAEEKKRIDEEKAILKQLIRAKSLPKI